MVPRDDALHPNRLRLQDFVEACLKEAAGRTGADARDLLLLNVQRLERHLRVASSWAAREDGRPPPAHLEGLSAFDLAEALDRLSVAASRA